MTSTSPTAVLPSTLRLGAVHLTVTDLDRSIAFYERSIGVRLHGRHGDAAALGAGGEDLLVLHEQRDARRAGRHAGLYHVAFLHPSRRELARAAVRLAATRTPISGASDHTISEAIYLSDPDGNGIELAADRPDETWPDLSGLASYRPEPLDLDSLLALVAEEEPQPHVDAALRVGHMHLHVGDLDRGLAFYRDVIGFELMTLIPGAAAFVSAGGYHHHLGFNVWRGQGVPPQPDGIVGLRHWTVVLDDAGQVAVADRVRAAGLPLEPSDGGFTVRDPWLMALRIVAR